VGYAPDDIMDKLITAKQGADLHTNFFSQRLLYEYLSANDIDAHIETIRALYKRQRDCMVDAIKRYFPRDVKCTEPEGGMFLWATLPGGQSALKLFDAAIAKNVAFVPGDPFYVDAEHVSTLRLNYTKSDEAAIEEGIKRLAGAIEERRGR
jgi:2-aminoadipate transaminase